MTQDPLFNYYSFTINDGNQLVFEYEHHYSDCPEIADDEGLKKLYFEIPMSLSTDRFVLDDSAELLAAKCLVSLSCECYPSLPVFVTTGSIEGTRLDANSWKIKADLVMPWNPQSNLQFEKVFLVR